MKMKAVIIANPKAGRGKAYSAVRRYVRDWKNRDWDVEILATEGPGHAGVMALELAENPPDLLAVCGGDGTVNEVASSISSPPFPVAVLPAGTANVIARELKLPLNPVRALDIGLKRSIRKVDLGELGPGARRRFVFVAGIGFDAYVAANVKSAWKTKFGMGAYAAEILRGLQTYPFREFQVVVNDQAYTATGCLAANAKSYGGGLRFCPQADMQDGLLDILIIQGRSRIKLARFLLRAWMGRPKRNNWTHRIRTDKLTVDGPAGIPVQADGESAGELPLQVSILPSTFPLVVP
ncbi:MAG: diacylglycerol kinase family lipid kinase [Acidobacteria bacterium]|nr:diacylglycerol kinase family lipid kinase [Acidobacteriota bacterium]